MNCVSGVFNDVYEDGWLLDSFVQRIISEIGNVEVYGDGVLRNWIISGVVVCILGIYKSVLILIDYVALIEVCNRLSTNFCIISCYKSFEYMLLVSNLINDKGLDSFVDAHQLEYLSLEALYTDRLQKLTENSY